jgi:hypothetical protein
MPGMDIEITDLGQIATLFCLGFTFKDIDRSNPKQVVFVFEDSTEIREIISEYQRDAVVCPAQSLFSALKRAKHILYDYQ